MATRFLALICPPQTAEGNRIDQLAHIATRQIELKHRVDLPGLQLFCDKDAACAALEQGQGAILGPVFDRTSGSAIAEWDAHRCATLIASHGLALIEQHWGHYIAFLKDGSDMIRIIRAPMGALPAYWTREGPLLILASDTALLAECEAIKPSIAWDQVAQHLLTPGLRTEATCLEDITELRGGCALSWSGNIWQTQELWSPWRFADRAQAMKDEDQAIRALRETTMQSMRSQTKPYRSMLVSLSGGLDSSIVAACASRASGGVSCLTLATRDARGDERSFARLMAQKIGARLFEVFEDASRVDMTQSHAGHLPRPVARAFAQSSEAATREIAAEIGAEAVLSGGGGDNLFCNMQSVLPIVDRLLHHGPGPGMIASARDMSRITQTSMTEILKRSLKRALRRDPRYRWPREAGLLHDAAVEAGNALAVHPWLNAPARALPGKAAHIAWLMHIENFLEGFDSDARLVKLSPLMTQPLAELCLRIPTWMWCAGGEDRALARRAFADLLPPDILARRIKGTHDSFVITLFDRNRAVLREMLADGQLVRNGLVDRAAMLDALSAEGPVRGSAYSRILALADVEAWVQAWVNRPRPPQ